MCCFHCCCVLQHDCTVHFLIASAPGWPCIVHIATTRIFPPQEFTCLTPLSSIHPTFCTFSRTQATNCALLSQRFIFFIHKWIVFSNIGVCLCFPSRRLFPPACMLRSLCNTQLHTLEHSVCLSLVQPTPPLTHRHYTSPTLSAFDHPPSSPLCKLQLEQVGWPG